jgi:hypothetical protein
MMFQRLLLSITLLISMLAPISHLSAQQCNLPAPNNLSVSYPTNNIAQVSWNAVPNAVGYRVTTTNLQNGQATVQDVTTTFATHNVDPLVPYSTQVQSMCNQNSVSQNTSAIEYISADFIIVIEVVLQSSNSTPNQLIAQDNNVTSNAEDFIQNYKLLDSNPVNLSFTTIINGVSQVFNCNIAKNCDDWLSLSHNYITTTSPWRIKMQGLGASECGDGGTMVNISHSSLPQQSSVISFYFKPGIGIFYIAKHPVSTVQIKSLIEEGGAQSDENITPPSNNNTNIQPGTEDLSVEARPIVVPNPFVDNLAIHMPEMGTAHQLTVFDMTGRVVHNQKIEPGDLNQSNCRLNTTEWKSGMYLIMIRDENGYQQVVKAIKI